MYDVETGAYYATATSQDDPSAFPILKSYNLVNWTVVGAIFPAGTPHPVWSSGVDYWVRGGGGDVIL